MHNCPRCGQSTSGSYSEGGLKWAICDDCMDADRRHAEEERRLTSGCSRPQKARRLRYARPVMRLNMEWKMISTAPKDGQIIDVWCVPPDDCDFEPPNGGIRLTNIAWHNANEVFNLTGWVRVCDDGSWDLVEGPPCGICGLPAWIPSHWMPIPEPPHNQALDLTAKNSGKSA